MGPLMSNTTKQHASKTGLQGPDNELLRVLKRRFLASNNIRRGICLLNAGQFTEAENAFRAAMDLGAGDESLPSYLAASLLGQGKQEAAIDTFARSVEQDPSNAVRRIRHALALASTGNRNEAIDALRTGVADHFECAELHFQLGTLLTTQEQYEEAELRFTQALNIDPDHAEARISLAMCYGVRGTPGEAVVQLQRAHAKRPHDARTGLLLAQAARAAQQQGCAVHVRTTMTDDDSLSDEQGIEELSRVIAAEPDFVDAFLAIPVGDVDEEVFAMLLKTLELALERQPEHAELHFHCGRVHDRLGQHLDAINHNERAVGIDSKFIRALIELGKLYCKTDRMADATTRLEQAVAAGAEYADVYYLLGNLYRDLGMVGRARTAYRRALLINNRYQEAREALNELPV